MHHVLNRGLTGVLFIICMTPHHFFFFTSCFSHLPFQPSCPLRAAVAASRLLEAWRLTAGAAAGGARRSCRSSDTERPPLLSPAVLLEGRSRRCCWTTTSTWPNMCTLRQHREARVALKALSTAPRAAPKLPIRYEFFIHSFPLPAFFFPGHRGAGGHPGREEGYILDRPQVHHWAMSRHTRQPLTFSQRGISSVRAVSVMLFWED